VTPERIKAEKYFGSEGKLFHVLRLSAYAELARIPGSSKKKASVGPEN
jgi:hypothetical protein